MRILKNLLFYSTLSNIVFWLTFPVLRWVLHLEFSDNDYSFTYSKIMFYAIPISIVFTLLRNKNGFKGLTTGRIIGTLSLAAFSVLFCFISFWGDMCSWSNEQVLFKSKKSENTYVIERSFGCGAFDSDLPTYKIFKVKKLSKYFVYAIEVDTTKLMQTEWIKIEN